MEELRARGYDPRVITGPDLEMGLPEGAVEVSVRTNDGGLVFGEAPTEEQAAQQILDQLRS
jgi:hypothetical protein